MKKIFEDGIHDISNEEYHAAAGFSKSKIVLMDKSPYHFWYETLSGLATKKEPTDALNIGSAFHTMLLEPQLFEKEYAIMPKLDRRTAKGKEEYSIFINENVGKTVLTNEQYEKVRTMTYHVKQHSIIDNLIDNVQFEKSIFWTDKETGLQFKSRPDIWANKMIVDLKTARDSSPGLFTYSADRNGYYLQAGMFFEACEAIGRPIDVFINLVIEKEEPYVPRVFLMDEKAINYGRQKFNDYKKQIKECMDSDKWRGYEVEEITAPKYAMIHDIEPHVEAA